MAGEGKIEEPIAETVLSCHKLLKASVDGPIISELGGEAKAEMTLAEVFSLMEKQKHGENGVLLNNGHANICYVRDVKGFLRSVVVYVNDSGWCLAADQVGPSNTWRAGYQVFSHNPL